MKGIHQMGPYFAEPTFNPPTGSDPAVAGQKDTPMASSSPASIEFRASSIQNHGSFPIIKNHKQPASSASITFQQAVPFLPFFKGRKSTTKRFQLLSNQPPNFYIALEMKK
jgi:hypothetical protein